MNVTWQILAQTYEDINRDQSRWDRCTYRCFPPTANPFHREDMHRNDISVLHPADIPSSNLSHFGLRVNLVSGKRQHTDAIAERLQLPACTDDRIWVVTTQLNDYRTFQPVSRRGEVALVVFEVVLIVENPFGQKHLGVGKRCAVSSHENAKRQVTLVDHRCCNERQVHRRGRRSTRAWTAQNGRHPTTLDVRSLRHDCRQVLSCAQGLPVPTKRRELESSLMNPRLSSRLDVFLFFLEKKNRRPGILFAVILAGSTISGHRAFSFASRTREVTLFVLENE